MSALHVVVHPRPSNVPSSALAPFQGLLDLVVDGINLTARVGQSQALAVLAELGLAVASLAAGRRERVTLQVYAGDEAWEIGLEPDSDDVLATVYRCGPRPEVAIHERRVSLAALREGVLEALAETVASIPNATAASLRSAQRALGATWPSVEHHPAARARSRVQSETVDGLELAVSADFRISGPPPASLEGAPQQLERADLHSLLVQGCGQITVRGKRVQLGTLHPFLCAERLLALAEEVLDAWQTGRPLFRRVEVGHSRIGVRRGPGDGPLTLTVRAVGDAKQDRTLSFPAVTAPTLVRIAVGFARALAVAFVAHDPSQSANLRLTALGAGADALEERLVGAESDDSLTNPEPETYRSYAPHRRSQGTGKWSHGGKMNLVPRWVATIPQIDLRATFLCGDRLLVGSTRETACIHRSSGTLAWRLNTQPAVSVVTPVGLARIHPEGRVVLHDIESGMVRFTTHVAPRVGGGATGAVVHTPALPKLLVVTENDRQITALDLVTGDVRWRYTARQAGDYRVRRAGKLLLVTGGDSALVALDTTTGEVVWRLRGRLPFTAGLAVDHDAGFAVAGTANAPGVLHHFDPWSGTLRWSSDLEERHVPGQPPLVTPEAVIVPSRDRRGVGARAFDRTTGESLWSHAPGLAAPTSAWLAVDQSIVANSASGALLCLEASTGRLRYNHVFTRQVDADQPRRLEPVLRNGALFVPQHQVHVVRPGDGEIIGTAPTDLIPDLLRVDERCDIYIAEESGHLAAFSVAPRLTLVS